MSESQQRAEKKEFIGRESEQQLLGKIGDGHEASIIIVYGRRRVGKTELLEHSFIDRGLMKFEGLEGKPEQEQSQHVLRELAKYVEEPMIADLKYDRWLPVFELIAKHVAKGKWTVYFEELQWLADYQDNFISELKHAWDNQFRHNPELLLVLCGSSPSFMVGKVLRSKALYNRSMVEIPLQPFTLKETADYLAKRSQREIMDAYLTVGGIPEYLKRIKTAPSLFLGICENAFKKGGFFVDEYNRIFISSLADNKHYKTIVDYLSHKKFATRDEIRAHLKIQSGGMMTALLEDLMLCGFIRKYSPYHLKQNSLLSRYEIQDHYLNFYFKFIAPIKEEVIAGDFQENPMQALELSSYHKWLGFSFERFCRQNHRLIAKILGFAAVRYKSGSFFSRAANKESPGYQIDLLFERQDKVITICEIRYLQAKVGVGIIEEFERKLALFPKAEKMTVHRVLITTEGASDELIARAYFDRVIFICSPDKCASI